MTLNKRQKLTIRIARKGQYIDNGRQLDWPIDVWKSMPVGCFPANFGLRLGCLQAQNDKIPADLLVKLIRHPEQSFWFLGAMHKTLGRQRCCAVRFCGRLGLPDVCRQHVINKHNSGACHFTADKWIRFALIANAGRWAMAWMHHIVIGQGEQLFTNAAQQQRSIAPWQIKAANAALK